MFGLLFFACTQALADDGEHRHADRVGRNIQEGGDVARHSVGRNGRGAEGGRQAGDRQLADLEHAVLDAGRDAHPQDAADEGQVGLQIGQVLDAEQAAGLFQQVDDRKAGDHPGDKAGQRGTHDAHLKGKDEHGVAADVHHVHHQTGQHADLAVALCAEERRTGVVYTDEGIAQRREQEIRLGVAHDVGVNGAEDAPQDAVPPHRHYGGDHDAERDHDEQDLGGGGLGVLRLPVADVLAGDDGTAGGKRAEQLDHQHVERVHQADARNGRFADRRDHQGIGQTDGHAERLLGDQRQQQGDKLFAGKQRLGCCGCHSSSSCSGMS